MKKWVRRVLEKFGSIPPTHIVSTVTSDYPDLSALPGGVLYVVGGKGYQKWAYLSCPCGCGAPIMLSLGSQRSPRWQIRIDWLQRPTIEPSVWQTDGCYSHFWVRQGRIDWVHDTGKRPPSPKNRPHGDADGYHVAKHHGSSSA
jgi:hypothetical protein